VVRRALLVRAGDERLTFVIVGLSLPIVAVAAGASLILGDRLPPARTTELRLLRAVPVLGPLSAPVLERLARAAIHVNVPAGGTIIREGELGDRFFVIVSGTAGVTYELLTGRVPFPGDGFGEIALLRDTPRTATVRAGTDARLWAVDRAPFLAALGASTDAAQKASGVVDEHLAREPRPVDEAERGGSSA